MCLLCYIRPNSLPRIVPKGNYNWACFPSGPSEWRYTFSVIILKSKVISLTQYLGTWWEFEKYPFVFEFGGKCIQAKYAISTNGGRSLGLSVRNQQTNAILPLGNQSIKGFAKVVGDGKLDVSFQFGPIKRSSPYWVLSTDYSNYAVVYSCQSTAELFHSRKNWIKNGLTLKFWYFLCAVVGVVWILTRSRTPSQQVIDTAYAALKQQQLDRQHLTRTDNSNCVDGPQNRGIFDIVPDFLKSLTGGGALSLSH